MIDGTSVAQTPRNLLMFVKVFSVCFFKVFMGLTPICNEKSNALGVLNTADISKLISFVVL
jgi:hypothetical protein